jgi:hypothetical protein
VSGDDVRHGTRRGYYAHRRDGEQACAACKRGAAAENERHVMNRARGRSGRLDPTGSIRRIQALVALGWTVKELGERLGSRTQLSVLIYGAPAFIFPATAVKIAALYEELSMRLPPETTRGDKFKASRARNVARREGWPPPLAWDDIDDPAERPRGIPSPTRKEASELLVEDWDGLRRQGHTRRQAAERMGIPKKRLEKAIERVGRRAEVAS